ncbi:Hypothetical predicted protein [Lecanosticta acicola]|uniref:Uncharacterized protein n=1 Tax=Lecanosticta acicola TaxID=111012 RepID=A0AAI8Z6E4_9PEZI|nr:Hypothetical predicted protein [Lecanosticta acicola]
MTNKASARPRSQNASSYLSQQNSATTSGSSPSKIPPDEHKHNDSGADDIRLIRVARNRQTAAREKPSVLSLLATCRAINHEAAGIFYDIHNFSIAADDLGKFHAHYTSGPELLNTLLSSPARLHGFRSLTIRATPEVYGSPGSL